MIDTCADVLITLTQAHNKKLRLSTVLLSLRVHTSSVPTLQPQPLYRNITLQID